MNNASMTARVSLFARAYHTEQEGGAVFADPAAMALLGREEYEQIAASMTQGISFFCPGFAGTPEEALAYVVHRQLAPSPLGRAAFAEQALEEAVGEGCTQYLIPGAGYDSFPCRRPAWAAALEVFSLDRPEMMADRSRRMEGAGFAVSERSHEISADLARPGWREKLLGAGFDAKQRSFCSLLGLAYYLAMEEWGSLLAGLRGLLAPGSRIAFDWPVQTGQGGGRTRRQQNLAAAAGEEMRLRCTVAEMQTLLNVSGFAVCCQLTPGEITRTYFAPFNRTDSGSPMEAFPGVHYCLARVV